MAAKTIRLTLSLLAACTIPAHHSCAQESQNQPDYTMNITANGHTMTATMEANSATEELRRRLGSGTLTVRLSDYGDFEKVGALGFTLPRSDRQTTTQPGDIVLYQGSQLVIFYGSNEWSYTRLGHIDNATPQQLRQVLGEGSVTVTMSLPGTSSAAGARAADKLLKTEVYSTDGRLLLSADGETRPSGLKSGCYIVKTTFGDGQTETKKVTI